MRLRHGDAAGALAAVESLLGAEAPLPSGPLRDELAAAAERRVSYGLFRAGLWPPRQVPTGRLRRRTGEHRTRPRLAAVR